MPAQPALKVAFMARMLWSKGPDLAVRAVTLAREQGADIRLSLYGVPDVSNPKAVQQEQLIAWSRQPGITYHGRVQDMNGVWRDHHLCLLPSRGGEGLPRALLEAACCGRGIITTDVPGCRYLVRDGIEGAVVTGRDDDALVKALADKLVMFAQNRLKMEECGRAARARIEQGFTTTHIHKAMSMVYKRFITL